MSTALLIIDVQQALCSGVGEVFEAARVIENINLAAAMARDARVLVVLIQHETDEGSFVMAPLVGNLPMDWALSLAIFAFGSAPLIRFIARN